MAGFPRYYVYEPNRPGEVKVVFDDHVMHADNLREHLEGFERLGDEEFCVQGSWIRPNVLVYANGIPRRMRDGLVYIVATNLKADFAGWVRGAKWPTTEKTMQQGVVLPGRWLQEEEAARYWLSFQAWDANKETMHEALKRRSVPMDRFRNGR